MSVESVRNRCIENHPDIDVDKLDKDIQKQITRFEKIVKTSFNESKGPYFKRYGINKDEIFEREKKYYIYSYLTILIDLFDYKESK